MDGLVQDCGNSSANAPELLQSCIKQSIWSQDLIGNTIALKNHVVNAILLCIKSCP